MASFFILNLVLNSSLELSFDEAYYWIYSEYLDFGYFDHPPIVGLVIRMGTALFGQTEMGVRFFFNALMCGSFYLIWVMLDKKHTRAMILMMLSMPLIYFSGNFALPDTPLLFFGCLFFYRLKKYIELDTYSNAIFLAVAIAGMFYSKYHGLLIVLLTVLGNLNFLKRKSFYSVAILVVILFAPHMYWQYLHDFVSFKFHLTGRVEKHFDIGNIINYGTGQIFLMGFLNTFLIAWLFFKNKFNGTFERILVFNSVGFFVFLFFMSFRNQIEANWTVTCSVALILLFAKLVNETMWKKFIVVAIIPIFIGLCFRFIIMNPGKIVAKFPMHDNRLNEVVDWKTDKIPAIVKLCGDRVMVGDSYQVTSKVSFYTGKKIPALHINSRTSQYEILRLEKNIPADQEICFFTSQLTQKSVMIKTHYKDPVYVVPNTTLEKLAKINGMTYAQIIRN
jgi:hypothetical protein